MKLSFRGFIVILLGLVCWATHDQSAVAQTPSPVLTCLIGTERNVYQIGEIPLIHVVIFNRTNEELWLVLALDGSERKARYPHAYFEIIGPDGKPRNARMLSCGTINPMEERNFVQVKPRADFDPYAGYACDFKVNLKENYSDPGEYRIRFYYSTDSDNPDKWGIPEIPGHDFEKIEANPLHRRLRKVPKTSIQSNELRITFVESETSTSQ